MVDHIVKRNAELILKYMQDGLSGIEQIELDKWLHTSGENKALLEKLIESRQLWQALADYAGNKIKTWEKIAATIAREEDHSAASNPLDR